MSLSKAEEIKMLRAFCQKLGDRDNSYTGEWLTAELVSLERAIMDDVPAECYAKTYREAEAVRKQLIDDAKAYADRLMEQAADVMRKAKDDAKALKLDAEVLRDELRDNCRRAESHIANARQALGI